jgi:GT2 family glycosyltransferase
VLEAFPPAVTVAIPTLGRECVLLDTIEHVLRLQPAPAEILVVDQTAQHEPATTRYLDQWQSAAAIRWLRRERPSIPAAMNQALIEANAPVVLFLDDDVIPGVDLIAAHQARYTDESVRAVVGQVLQPGQQPTPSSGSPRGVGLRRDLEFQFSGTEASTVANVMAGNLSVRRDFALQVGGFDENFVGVAYRFETEFCRRLLKHGGTVMFEPGASIRHLAAASGGTRAYGRHLTSANPAHSVGDYYFAMLQDTPGEAFKYFVCRCHKRPERQHLSTPGGGALRRQSSSMASCWNGSVGLWAVFRYGGSRV